MNHSLYSYLLPLLLSIAAIGVSHADNTKAKPTSTVPTVTVSNVALTDIVERTPISGTLVARKEVYVNTRINGYAIEKLHVDEGDRVKKGDVLVALDTTSLKLQVLQARADLARSEAAIAQAQSQINAASASYQEAREDFKRSLRLRRARHISEQDHERSVATNNTAKANLRSAESGLVIAKAQSEQVTLQLRLAKDNLANAVIHSPVSGIIAECAARLGAIASAGAEPLCKIIKDGLVEMEAEVIETTLGKVTVGLMVDLVIAGTNTVQGSVRHISPTVDARTRLAKVSIKLPKADNLRPGLSGNGWILGESRQALTVPTSAITTEEGKTVVSVVNNGTVEKHQVVTGSLSSDGRREVTSGVTLDEKVITKSGIFYRAGDAVKAINSSSVTSK